MQLKRLNCADRWGSTDRHQARVDIWPVCGCGAGHSGKFDLPQDKDVVRAKCNYVAIKFALWEAGRIHLGLWKVLPICCWSGQTMAQLSLPSRSGPHIYIFFGNSVIVEDETFLCNFWDRMRIQFNAVIMKHFTQFLGGNDRGKTCEGEGCALSPLSPLMRSNAWFTNVVFLIIAISTSIILKTNISEKSIHNLEKTVFPKSLSVVNCFPTNLRLSVPAQSTFSVRRPTVSTRIHGKALLHKRRLN